jgi:hypothetical protein
LEPSDVEEYARAAARVMGLDIDDAWWLAVRLQLATLLELAAVLEAADIDWTLPPAPVFEP